MNIETIRTQLLSVLNANSAQLGETATLTQEQLNDITDACAVKLETVNPTTTYPPTGR